MIPGPNRRVLLAAALVCSAGMAFAQSAFPNKPVRMIVPQPPGGGFDFVGRLLADRMGKQMGQSFIVENKPGSGTLIGTDFVAKSAPDVTEAFRKAGGKPMSLTLAETRALVERDVQRWTRLIRDADIKSE